MAFVSQKLILDFSLEFWKRGEGTEKGEESIPK
jgi:hypothetical protein